MSTPTHYVSDEAVSDEVFDGEDVPGPNTITKERHERILTRIDNKLNSFISVKKGDPLVEDTFGDLENAGVQMYKAVIENEPFEIPEDSKRDLVDNGYVGVGLVVHNTRNYRPGGG